MSRRRTFPRRPAMAALLAAALLIGLVPAAPGAAHVALDHACPDHRVPQGVFTDVDPASTHGPAIDCAAEWTVTEGQGDGRYGPSLEVTRAQTGTFLVRLMTRYADHADDLEMPDPAPADTYDDVAASHPHAEGILTITAAGIAQGTGERTFAPEQPLTRAQLATLVVNLHAWATGEDLRRGGSEFEDVGTESPHHDAINGLADAEIVQGVGDGRYRPGRDVARAAMASFLMRHLDLLVERGDAPAHPPARLLAAGDIATCGTHGHEATARLLDGRPGVVAPLGDLAYPDGTATQLRECYDPTWGRHRERTRPAPGNHDYHTSDGDPYYDYFGAAAGPHGRGYYSYELNPDWHAVVLNTNCGALGGCGVESAQYQWLAEDLAAHDDQHVLVYGHHPRFSSGRHGPTEELDDIFSLLHRSGVALYLAAHDHHYERLEPVDPQGEPDPDGVRQFVVGTGGKTRYDLEPALPTTQARTNETYGVLALELLEDEYRWRFHPTDPDGLDDAGETPLR